MVSFELGKEIEKDVYVLSPAWNKDRTNDCIKNNVLLLKGFVLRFWYVILFSKLRRSVSCFCKFRLMNLMIVLRKTL